MSSNHRGDRIASVVATAGAGQSYPRSGLTQRRPSVEVPRDGTRARAACTALVVVALLMVGCRTRPPRVNVPPETPRFMSSTTNVLVGSQLSLAVTVSDPDTDDIRVRFAWSEGDTSEWSGWQRWGNWFGARACGSPDTFAVYVQAQDDSGAVSGWAGPCSALCWQSGNLPPHTPTLAGPDTVSAAGGSYYVQAALYDPEGEDVAVRVDYGNGRVTWWSQYFEHASSLLIPCSSSSPGTYVVRVRARDPNLNESFWSPGHTIVVVP